MCDPVSLIAGAAIGGVAAKALTPKAPRAAAAADPEAERMKAEADAAAAANRKLAADKLRRREQQSLIARGAPSLGDEQNTGQGVINRAEGINAGSTAVMGRLRSRGSTTAPQSLVSRGAPGGYGGGGRMSASTVLQ